MDKRHQVRSRRLHFRDEPLRRDDLAHLRLDADCLRSRPLDDGDHALAEYPLDCDQCPIPWLEQVDQARLHPCTAGCGQRKGESVLGGEDRAQLLLHPVEDAEERRVEVSDHRVGQCAQHRLRHVAGTGPEEESLR